MKNLLKLIFIVVMCLMVQVQTFADNYKLLILPDNLKFETTDYLIYPDTSILFASDFANELKKDGRISVVSMAHVRDVMRKDKNIARLTEKALHEYKYNYNISYVDLKSIAKYFNVNNVLLVTSETDTQNYVMRRTLWDFLNIPGTTPIDSMYKLSTYISLVDVNDEYVIWEKTYYKKISSMEYRVIPNTFAPATEQLHKIKAYSKNNLSPLVASIVMAKILPEMKPATGMMKNYNTVKSLRTNVLPSPVNYVSPKTDIKKAVNEYVKMPKKQQSASTSNSTKKSTKRKNKMNFKNTKFYKFFTLPDEPENNSIMNTTLDDEIMIPDEETDLNFTPSDKPINKPVSPRNHYNEDYGVMINAL